MQIENEDDIARYYKLKKSLEQIQDQMSTMMNEPKYLLSFLQPGRLVTVEELSFSIEIDSRKLSVLLQRSNLVIFSSIGVLC